MFDDVHDARELIAQAIGAGSMCWVGGTGDLEFDSTQATEVADSAFNRLQVILAGLLTAPIADRATGADVRALGHAIAVYDDEGEMPSDEAIFNVIVAARAVLEPSDSCSKPEPQQVDGERR